MDGAIIVDEAIKRLAWANVQLMPDPTIPSDETGTRHRTAERVAKQTGALVVSVSQQRETGHDLRRAGALPARPGRRRARQDEPGARRRSTPTGSGSSRSLTRLTALEFQNAVVLDDVLVVLQRAEMTSRMAERIDPRLRRARQRGTADRAAARGARRRRAAGARRDRPRLPRPRRRRRGDAEALARLGGAHVPATCSSSGGSAELLGYDRGINPLDQTGRAARLSARSRTSRGCREPLIRRVVADSGASTRSSAPRSASSRRSRASAPCAPRDPRGAPTAAGAQPRRPLPAALRTQIWLS